MRTLNDFTAWRTIEKIRNERIFLLGLNFWTKLAFKQLLRLNIFVEGFLLTDEQREKKSLRYLNKPMFLPDELPPREDYFLINASEDCPACPPEARVLDLWRRDFFEQFQRAEIFSEDERSFQILEGTKNTYLNYLIKCSTEKKLILCGTVEEIVSAARKFDLLGIKLDEALDTGSFTGTFSGLNFISPYDLFYKDGQNFMVVVLPNAEEFILNFLRDSNFNPAAFIRYEDIRRFDVPVCFDPNLGYNLKKSPVLFSGKPRRSKNFVRIGILGGSTSDPAYFAEKSWAEHLIEIADAAEIPIKIYNGAVRGYSVSLELVKFIRDMAQLNLDFLISVSGINEQPCATPENPFVTRYQKIIFENVAAARPKNFRRHMDNSVFYGAGIENLAQHWISAERMLHAIAEDFGTKFYAILQPGLLTRAKFSAFDLEVLEHWFDEKKIARYDVLKNIRDELRKMDFPWLKDFTWIFDKYSAPVYFDGCHLWSNANRRFAEEIFKLIEEDLRRRSEL